MQTTTLKINHVLLLRNSALPAEINFKEQTHNFDK